jgi:beta-carotene hydroxylase
VHIHDLELDVSQRLLEPHQVVHSDVANIAGVAILGYLFYYAVHSLYDQTSRFKNTNTIILPHWIHGPVTFLWLWQNYHSIHHLYPKIPFYQYAEVFNQIVPGVSERGAPIQYGWH